MAVTRRTRTARQGRQIALTRGKDNKTPAKNRLVVRKDRDVSAKKPDKKNVQNRPPRDWRKVWRGIGKSGMVALVGCICAILVVGVSLGLLYSYRYATRTQYFSLKEIEIQGNARLTSREILEIAQLDDGVNLLELSIEDVKREVSRNPWVRDVSVRRELPGKLVIGIKERDPAFWVLLQEEMYYADERGSIIAPVVTQKFVSLPTLEVEKGAEDIGAKLPELLRSLEQVVPPIDMKTMSFLRLSTARGIELYMENSQLKIVIGLEDWLQNLQRLNLTLMDLKRRKELHIVREIKAQGANVWVEKGKNTAPNS